MLLVSLLLINFKYVCTHITHPFVLIDGIIDQLAWVGPMAWNTANFSRSQLEWMAAPLGRQFDSLLG